MQPVAKVCLHSTDDAAPLAALLLPQIFPIFSVVAPCRRGASPVSVRRQTFTTGCWPLILDCPTESMFARMLRCVSITPFGAPALPLEESPLPAARQRRERPPNTKNGIELNGVAAPGVAFRGWVYCRTGSGDAALAQLSMTS